MNTLRPAVRDYLTMRRSLGYKLQGAGKGLFDFVAFMEEHRAPYITPYGQNKYRILGASDASGSSDHHYHSLRRIG